MSKKFASILLVLTALVISFSGCYTTTAADGSNLISRVELPTIATFTTKPVTTTASATTATAPATTPSSATVTTTSEDETLTGPVFALSETTEVFDLPEEIPTVNSTIQTTIAQEESAESYTSNIWGIVSVPTEADTPTGIFPVEKGVYILIYSECDTSYEIAWYGATATIPCDSVRVLDGITSELEEQILLSRTAGVVTP